MVSAPHEAKADGPRPPVLEAFAGERAGALEMEANGRQRQPRIKTNVRKVARRSRLGSNIVASLLLT